MAEWSQSQFLQSLGWATLNSLWQLALLWCIFLIANFLFKFSSQKKYILAVAAVVTGFFWFVLTFLLYYQQTFTSFAISQNIVSENVLNVVLIPASVTYLMLLLLPAYRLFNNWLFVKKIRKEGLSKAKLEYRLFIQKVASQLGISKKVLLYVSEVVSSPVTIGYLKPIILLPFAALNNLSVHQVEAILLHELSHIRRYDYLVNFIISIIHTLLYFNPFIKYFIRQIEEERENCCDEMVLQYGYDKVSYASALLTLEKASAQHHLLVLGATGKKNLITRIEKIIGMEKKKSFRLAHLVPVFAAIICILTFNSILIINDAKQNGDLMLSSNHVVHPFYFIENSSKEKSQTPAVNLTTGSNQSHVASNSAIPKVTDVFTFEETTEPAAKPMELPEGFIHVDFDEVDAQLSKEQKKQVKTTVEATKKVMTTLQWLEVENAIADVLNKDEKALVKDEYLKELEALNWKNVELNLKSNYDKIDWSKVNNNISNALTVIQLDSIQRSYNLILSQIEKAEAQVNGKLKDCISPLPDVSVEEMKKTKEEVKKNIEAVKAVQEKKIIKI